MAGVMRGFASFKVILETITPTPARSARIISGTSCDHPGHSLGPEIQNGNQSSSMAKSSPENSAITRLTRTGLRRVVFIAFPPYVCRTTDTARGFSPASAERIGSAFFHRKPTLKPDGGLFRLSADIHITGAVFCLSYKMKGR